MGLVQAELTGFYPYANGEEKALLQAGGTLLGTRGELAGPTRDWHANAAHLLTVAVDKGVWDVALQSDRTPPLHPRWHKTWASGV
jgi:hypothetical protein